MRHKILIVEDEIKIANVLVEFLQPAGFAVECCHDGAEALDHFESFAPDLIVLDLMLPNVDGLTIAQQVRANSRVPIIMLTAKVDEIDRLLGLELGADDYICKPFSPREVVARVRTILRRVSHQLSVAERTDHCEYGEIKIDQGRFECTVQGEVIELTPVEFRMVSTLVSKPGRVFSRANLMSAAYPDNRIVSDRTIDSHIKNIRRKLSLEGKVSDNVHSIYGVGYKLE